jgi:hypothetical protein
MNGHLFISILPGDLCRLINQFCTENAQRTIVKFYYNRIKLKNSLAQFFIDHEQNFRIEGFYRINAIPHFMKSIRMCDRVLSGVEDWKWWNKRIRNLRRTVDYEYSLYNTSIIFPDSLYELVILIYNIDRKFRYNYSF